MGNHEKLRQKLAYHETFNCVQCGYCLPACPTYVSMGKETHSPRGRINLVKMAAEGNISLEALKEPIDLCLGCRACETACPTNVQYGKILASAVEVLSDYHKQKRTVAEKVVRKLVFTHMFPNRNVLHFIGSGLSLYQHTHLDQLVRKLGLTAILPKPLQEMEKAVPVIQKKAKRKQKWTKEGEQPRYRIGFFVGCVMEIFFSKVNDLSMKLLTAAGCEVILLKEQTCCGALHHHIGEKEMAIRLAKKNLEVFERLEFDYVVNSIGGCGAMLIEYHHLFDQKDEWYLRAKQFSEKCVDTSIILAQLELPFKTPIRKTVSYQPSCHLKNVQKVSDEPIALIKRIPGITYTPMKEMDMCCGSAGIYNMMHYDEAMDILDRKMRTIHEVMPEVIVTTNPGCHLQMMHGVRRAGLQNKIKVVHLIELLAESCEVEG